MRVDKRAPTNRIKLNSEKQDLSTSQGLDLKLDLKPEPLLISNQDLMTSLT
jgi:hypothetical protein